MRASQQLPAAVTFAVAFLAFAFILAGAASALPLDAVSGIADLLQPYSAELSLVALRAKLGELEGRAAAKLAEVKDDTPPEKARQIESEHQALVTEIAQARTEVAAKEREGDPNATATAVQAAVTAERVRLADIHNACRTFGMPELAEDFMARGIAIAEVRKEIQDKLAARSAASGGQHQRIGVLQDEQATRRQLVQNALEHRTRGSRPVKLEDGARVYRGMSLLEMGRSYLEDQGVRVRGLDKMELAGVLTGRALPGYHTTGDFANVLGNVVRTRLREAYAVAPARWKEFSRQSNAPDFKERAVAQFTSAPKLKLVRESAEFTYGTFGDSAEKYSLATYGRIVAITRQAIINDDLGAFDRIPTMFGRQAAELQAEIVYGILKNNPTMADGVALFHATHGNLAGAGTAIDTANLGKAKAAVRKQKGFGDDSEPMNIVPKFLIVGAARETEAQAMMANIVATKAGDVNVFQNAFEVISDARLEDQPWFMAADPASIDTIEYAYLEGEEDIFTEERWGFEVDGVEIKARLDFAAKAIDWRGLYKNAGNAL